MGVTITLCASPESYVDSTAKRLNLLKVPIETKDIGTDPIRPVSACSSIPVIPIPTGIPDEIWI